jgi:protein ImuB
LLARSALQESAAHAALLDCAQSFSPCVEDSAYHTVLLDLAGMESLLGPIPEIARAICSRAADLRLEANVAVASNPDAAEVAARGFSGVTVIPPGKEAECLESLPVEVLFAGRGQKEEENPQSEEAGQLLEIFERWGVRSLRALAALPEIALSERLGQYGVHLQQLARGTASRTLVPVEEPLVFEEAVELEYPIVLLEPLAFLLNRLLEQLCARLASRALSTQELRLTLELEQFARMDYEFENLGIPSESDGVEDAELRSAEQPLRLRSGQAWAAVPTQVFSSRRSQFTRTLRLPLPMLDAKLFLKLLQLDLNAHPPGAPIVKIHLAAEPARPRPAQAGLFVPPTPEPEKLELTLARIGSMVGENRVGALELLDTHHPERFRLRRFVPGPAPVQPPHNSAFEEKKESSAVTALRRYRPALRASVTLEQGQPARVVCRRRKEVQGEVLWKAGPWRSSGDWWERTPWARDEWDIAVQTSGGVVLYRLVHDLLEGNWFVEGTYD